MSNAANRFHLPDFFYTGTNGDLLTSNGLIQVLLRVFPSSNAVFVDKNYAELSDRGILAYGNINDALTAWRSGGAAYVKWGAPSASNPALILVGVGDFDITSGGSGFGGNDPVDYMHIIGISPWLSRIVQSGDFETMFVGTPVSVKIENIWLVGAGTHGCKWHSHSATSDPNCLIFKNCIFTGWIQNGSFTNCSGYIICEDCLFQGGIVQNYSMIHCRLSLFRCRNLDPTLAQANENNIAINTDGGWSGTMKDCWFNQFVLGSPFTNSVTGKILNCHLTANNYDEANKDLIYGAGTGLVISNSRLCGKGSGLAVNSYGAATVEITNCSLRRPTGDVPGSSISSSITNASPGGHASNEELLGSTTE